MCSQAVSYLIVVSFTFILKRSVVPMSFKHQLLTKTTKNQFTSVKVLKLFNIKRRRFPLIVLLGESVDFNQVSTVAGYNFQACTKQKLAAWRPFSSSTMKYWKLITSVTLYKPCMLKTSAWDHRLMETLLLLFLIFLLQFLVDSGNMFVNFTLWLNSLTDWTINCWFT